jgi:hypothetical protein
MLYYNTVNDLLKNSLITLMNAPIFENFRLVGGTALSLQIGHRESIDIDLFSDADYGTIDFEEIETFLRATFSCVNALNTPPALGKSYFIGDKERDIQAAEKGGVKGILIQANSSLKDILDIII